MRSALTALMSLVRRQANLAGGIVTFEAPVPVARTVDDVDFGFGLADFAPAVEGAPKAKAPSATQASAHLLKGIALDDAFPPPRWALGLLNSQGRHQLPRASGQADRPGSPIRGSD